MESSTTTAEPLLRTLSPLLSGLERDLRIWLEGMHRYPLPLIARGSLEGMSNDLKRQSDALNVDRPLLVIMLMGGTGVGKSTLLNALAGAPIAQASFTRPTTRDPVVYYHNSIKPDRFDPALRHCRLVQHDRESLAHKILVDTPDIDSNDVANREKLIALLPVADIVLYVGSQEKYHDKLGWELFKEQRKRRAFAFVLNKWDRCSRVGPTGVRPDEDLLKDLREEGFEKPLLFRTVAQTWLDHRLQTKENDTSKPTDLPEGEQFADLLYWLELGLTRLEIEAVKARGVSQLFQQLQEHLAEVRPPDLQEQALKTEAAWQRIIGEESDVFSDVFISTLEPYQNEIEHHFSVEGQQKFQGLMAMYLRFSNSIRYAGSSLRDRIPLVGGGGSKKEEKLETPTTWDLTRFAHECTRVAGERVLDKRGMALVNRLLVEADQQQFPVHLLNTPTNEAARIDWHQRYDRALIDALAEVERICTRPTGLRKFIQVTLVGLANHLPMVVLVGGYLVLLYRFFMQENYNPSLFDVFLPLILTLIVMVLLHVLIMTLLPLRWGAVRGEFQTQLTQRLQIELNAVYGSIPTDVAKWLTLEREQVEKLIRQVQEVQQWLEERQQAASIAGLYGN